jgi:polyisoprenoid-binding protein YceI
VSTLRRTGLAVGIGCAFLSSAATHARGQCTDWEIVSVEITFEIRNAGLPVRGSFTNVGAAVCFDPTDPGTGRFSGWLGPASIETGIAMRDGHLAKRSYFDVARYPRIEMRSVRVNGAGDEFTGRFILRIRDVEREVEVPFSFDVAGETAVVDGSLVIDRLDYGIGSKSLILSDSVIVRVALKLARPAARWPPGHDGYR